jgi:hypothetical protein
VGVFYNSKDMGFQVFVFLKKTKPSPIFSQARKPLEVQQSLPGLSEVE